MAWPFNNQGDTQSVLPIDYGTQQLAKYANQNWFPNEVDETVTGVEYPGGNPVYPGNPGLYQDRIMNMPAASTNKYIQRKEEGEPGVLRNMWEGTKNLASNLNPLGIVNALTRRKGADQSFGGYPGGQFSRAGLFPQEVSNLQSLADQGWLRSGGKDFTGTNVVSGAGDYNKHIAERKALFEGKLQDKDYLSRFEDPDEINTLQDLYKAYQTKYGKNSAIAQRLNLYSNFGGGTGTAADKITGRVTTGAPQFITRDGATPSSPVTTGGGGTFDPVLDQRGRRVPGSAAGPSWRGATAAREARGEQVAGPGFGRGSYWAEGGRVGYQGGELVEDESMMEATPTGMMEENIEEVQGEPSREQLEAIAFEIFQLPLEELNEEQLEVVYQAAMEQEPSEEEVQFAAQEGPGEGIASLV
jgi:hypothetical protein